MDRLRQLLAAGGTAYGTIVTMPGVAPIQVLAACGFDFLMIDMEHGAIGIESACAMIAASAVGPATPIVRIAANEPWMAKTLLDVGAAGIAVPMVNSGPEALRAARSLRYPPAGTRAWGPFYAPLRWGLQQERYAAQANGAVLCIAFVEHADALASLDAILAVEGVDVVLVGAGDLATSLGHLGNMQHPQVREAVRHVEARVLAAGKVLGGFAESPESGRRLAAAGYRFVVCGLDCAMLADAAARACATLRAPGPAR